MGAQHIRNVFTLTVMSCLGQLKPVLLPAKLKALTALIFILCSATAFSSLAQGDEQDSTAAGNKPAPDVRVLIDISGSMKHNDPLNLRRPALELLVQLFPENAKAGVWTFGQWVNNLVPSETVTAAWRQQASIKAKGINAVALHTNIPEALQRALDDEALDPVYQTHFILLTDGMVDISKNPEKNAQARAALLGSQLPALREAGVRIHTVALSKNADSELMELLAVETDGLAAVAESADDLTAIFLQAFDAAAPAEELPLEDNRFLVDSSIEEFTALVFRKEGSAPTVLQSPDNKQYSQKNLGADGEVRWFSQENYDLITVQRPYEGEWTIKADLEPNSRVTIVSNLSLQLNRLPRSYFLGDELELQASLLEQGQRVTSPDFLDLIDVSYQVQRRSDGEQWLKNLSDLNPHPDDGIFAQSMDMLEQPAVYDITVTADAKTFQRKQKHTLEVRPNFILSARPDKDKSGSYKVTLSTKNPEIDTESLTAEASISSAFGEQQASFATFTERSWQLAFTGAEQSVLYDITVHISGRYRDGRALTSTDVLQIDHLVPGTVKKVAEPKAETVPEAVPEPAAEPEVMAAVEQAPAETEAEVEAEGMDWSQIALYAGLAVGNLLVLVLGYFAYRMVKGKSGSDVLDADDDIEPVAEAESPEDLQPVSPVDEAKLDEPEEGEASDAETNSAKNDESAEQDEKATAEDQAESEAAGDNDSDTQLDEDSEASATDEAAAEVTDLDELTMEDAAETVAEDEDLALDIEESPEDAAAEVTEDSIEELLESVEGMEVEDEEVEGTEVESTETDEPAEAETAADADLDLSEAEASEDASDDLPDDAIDIDPEKP